MAETMTLIPVRTSRQGTSLNAGKLKTDYRDETSTVELHRDDMTRLGLKKGDKIRLKSENGSEAIVSCKERKGSDPTAGLIFMAYGPTSSLFMDEDTAGSGMPLSKHLTVEIEGPLAEDGSVMTSRPAPMSMQDSTPVAGALLTPEQSASLQNLLATPLSPTQAAWISGYFAALSGQPSLLGATATTAAPTLPRMTLLYGSQTGNGEGLAEELHEQAQTKGFNSRVIDMADFDPADIVNEEILFIIVSTHGEGDPPVAAEKLHHFLGSDDAPRLEKLKFAVFALGDSSYEFFCKTGKDFDRFLEQAGATRILDRVDADIDFEKPAQSWAEAVLAAYQSLAEQAGGTPAASGESRKSAGKSKFSKTNPYHAAVLRNINLNGEGSAKETRHIEIDLGDSGLSYTPGDALGVYPLNNPAYVDELLTALKLDGTEAVTIGKETLPVRDAFIEKLDITALSRVNMEKYADLTGSEELKTLLDDNHKQEFNDYTWGRQILDLIEEYPAAEKLSAQQFTDILRRIPGRLYSIASSLSAHPGQVHLLVGAVRYQSFGRNREGVCSTFLAERIQPGEKLAIYVQVNKNFRLPDNPDTPVIMVGPGTGLAPFCAFLQERKASGAKGKNWLFFGDQHQATDYLYGETLEQYQSEGLLTHLSLAFSRDQEQKIYVQTRILEQAAELFQWLEEGAYFYVCGDASRMANDVHQALLEIIRNEGGNSPEEAEAYLNRMIDAKRYQRDVY